MGYTSLAHLTSIAGEPPAVAVQFAAAISSAAHIVAAAAAAAAAEVAVMAPYGGWRHRLFGGKHCWEDLDFAMIHEFSCVCSKDHSS